MEILDGFDILYKTFIFIKPYFNLDILMRFALVYSMPIWVCRHTLAISEGLAYLESSGNYKSTRNRQFSTKTGSIIDIIKANNKSNFKALSPSRSFSVKREEGVNEFNIDIKLSGELFGQLMKLLEGPLNEDTQIKIEKYLSEQGISMVEDINSAGIAVNKLRLPVIEYIESGIYKVVKVLLKIKKKYEDLSDDEKLGESLSDINVQILKKKDREILIGKIFRDLDLKVLKEQVFILYLKVVTHNEIIAKDDESYHLENSEIRCFTFLGKNLVNLFVQKKRDEQKILRFSEARDLLLASPIYRHIFTDDFIVHLGAKIVEIMQDNDLIQVKQVFVTVNDSPKVIVPPKELEGEIPINTIMYSPFKLPMIVPPKKYSANESGGYLLNDVDYVEGMITKKMGQKGISSIEKSNIIYDSINGMMKVAFKINRDLLDYLTEYNDIHQLLILEGTEKYTNNKDLANLKGVQKREFQKYLSLKQDLEYILSIALLYKNVPEIFFPLRLDNRGRIYPITHYLHYQGSELAKALLLFARGDEISRDNIQAIDYLKAYGGNLYGHGLDKQSYIKRIAWVDQNWDKIINFEDNIAWVKQAENKFLFLAFCLEIRRFDNFLNSTQQKFKTYLPIQLDGTCNGFQHLAFLANEVDIFQHLNLDGKNKDKDIDPEDLYTFFIQRMAIQLASKYRDEKDIIKKERYNRLRNIQLTRKNIKPCIMTLPYNVSIHSMINYLKDTLVVVKTEEVKSLDEVKNIELLENVVESEMENEDSENLSTVKYKRWFGTSDKSTDLIDYQDIVLYCKTLLELITQVCPNIKALMVYLEEMTDIMINLDLPIIWRLPTGLTVCQKYMNIKKKTLRPYTYLNTKVTLSIVDNVKMNKIKNKNATMPNLIHSLDAASLTLLFDTFYRVVKANNRNINFYSVHDCYGVTAPHVETLITQLRSVYIKLYSKELYIKTFEEDILGEIFKAYSNDIIYDKNNRILYIKKSKGNEVFKLPKFPYNVDDDKRNKHYDDFKKGMLFIK